MYDLIEQKLEPIQTREEKLHCLREFLQVVILRIMYETNQFQFMAFVGGTCLRLLYHMRRFSEDLDFSLIERQYRVDPFVHSLEMHLKKMGFIVELKIKSEKNMNNTLVKFSKVLQDFTLSSHPNHKLNIRIEIDTNPPVGWNREISLLSDDFIFPITHHDLPSLFATKLHALLFRKYHKGRDYYDIMWYLSKRIVPNFPLLNNAIEQTQRSKSNVTRENFISLLTTHFDSVDFDTMRRDVAPFIMDRNELDLIEKDVFKSLLEKYELEGL